MSRGKNLQEMEVGTKQSQTAVNAGAKAAEAMASGNASGVTTPGQPTIEDLGGPTPENYKTDDDSAKLKEPGATLAQVKDVVNKGAKPAEPMKAMAKEDSDVDEEDTITEEEISDSEEDTLSEEEVEAIAEVEEQIEEDVSALLSGEELSEEFRSKARLVFESALNARTEQRESVIAAHYERELQEQLGEIYESLSERMDSYLEYVADEWITENAIAVERGIQSQANESFLSGLKGLFEEHYVSIPEEKYDVLESMVEKLDDMETKLNEQIDKNVALNKRLAESAVDNIFAEISEGLALSQKEKLASLAETVGFDSEEDYREKLVTLRESYFPSNVVTQRNTQDYISEDVNYSLETPVTGIMGSYLQTLERVSKK